MRMLLLAALSAAPATAQTMDHSQHMPGMTMPAPKPAPQQRQPATRPKPAARAAPAKPAACAPEHAAMGHCRADPAPAAPDHAAMGHAAPAAAPTEPIGTALPAGTAPAPPAPHADYADRIWGREAMAPARAMLHRHHGGMAMSQVMLNLAEVRVARGRDGYHWDGEAWFGGDVHRLAIKTEGEGGFGSAAGGQVQALYSRAVGPYFNLQAGVRQDIAPGPDRTYASVGVEGLAPYWFDVEATAFLSDRGDLLGRVEGSYDQRITQRLILQPRLEANLSAQDMARNRIGSGLTDAEVGLRLRYEIVREFAPYVGVAWERKFGDTARFARADGERTGGVGFVAGVRAWF